MAGACLARASPMDDSATSGDVDVRLIAFGPEAFLANLEEKSKRPRWKREVEKPNIKKVRQIVY